MTTLATSSALRPSELSASTSAERISTDERATADEAATDEAYIKLSFTWAGSSHELDIAESDR